MQTNSRRAWPRFTQSAPPTPTKRSCLKRACLNYKRTLPRARNLCRQTTSRFKIEALCYLDIYIYNQTLLPQADKTQIRKRKKKTICHARSTYPNDASNNTVSSSPMAFIISPIAHCPDSFFHLFDQPCSSDLHRLGRAVAIHWGFAQGCRSSWYILFSGKQHRKQHYW